MKTPHTMTARGRTVRIGRRDGSVVIGRFIERTRRKVIVLDVAGEQVEIQPGDIKSMSDRRLLQPVSACRR